jgi:hypothetical protein
MKKKNKKKMTFLQEEYNYIAAKLALMESRIATLELKYNSQQLNSEKGK